MKNDRKIMVLVLAGLATIVICFWIAFGRYEVRSGSDGIYKVDRFTGKTVFVYKDNEFPADQP
jgi:hypothetical protein